MDGGFAPKPQRAVLAQLDGAEERNGDAALAGEDRILRPVDIAPEIVEEDRLPPASTLEAGKSGLLAGLAATKERLKTSVQSPQGSAQHDDRYLLKLRSDLPDLGELLLLINASDRRALFAPGVTAFLQRSVVQLARQVQPAVEDHFLFARRAEPVLEGAEHGRRGPG